MTVYVDELFFINFIACYASLYLFSAFRELERSRLRMLTSAATGAMIALIRFCTSANFILTLSEIFIPLIAFRKIKTANIIMFMIMKYILSGFALLAVSMFGGANAVIKSGIIYFNIKPMVFIAVLLIVYPLFTYAMRLIKKHRRLYRLHINLQGAATEVQALYDSGNLLKNPYDGSSVIIVDKTCLKPDEESGFMLIPFSSLGNSGMIKAFKADKVYCMETNTELKNVTIGISEMTLSKTGQYQALIGPGIFKE